MKLTRLALATALLAASAHGQTIFFEDTFDSGIDNWTSSLNPAGQHVWHWIESSDPCAPSAFPSPGGAARMGDSDCTFNSVGSSEQILGIAAPIYIPAEADHPELSFTGLARSEGCFHWDFHYVEVRRVGETGWSLRRFACGSSWQTYVLDLSDYRGDEIEIQFRFDPVDGTTNGDLGWIIDDVRVTAAQCYATNFCVRTPNSASALGASMAFSGSGRIHVNDFVLNVTEAPPNEFALFFCGPEKIQMPLGDGTLCVGPGNVGIMRLGSVERVDAQGNGSHPLDVTGPDVAAASILPGTNWQFQCWFRDGPGGPAGSNLSDGLSVTFCP